MLDFASVKRQINQMVQEQKDAQNRFLKRMKLVSAEFERWSGDWETLADKVSLSKTSWPVAGISEPLNGSYPPPERPKQLTVIATDGSQIFPDRHEISSCYLINIGFVAIHYGTGERPTLSSRPFLFYKDQDLHRDWAGKRTFMSNEIFAMKREALEFSELALLAEGSRSEGRTAVALSDGTLILWPLEGVPTDFKATTLEGFLSSLDRLRETQIPLAGYISQPGSTDVINSLRVGLCPEESPNCDKCPWKDIAYESQRRSKLPCAAIEGVTDQILFSHI
ncbi:MAG: DNA double-strand break repair nuclease NurA, partial [bacterium]